MASAQIVTRVERKNRMYNIINLMILIASPPDTEPRTLRRCCALYGP